MCSSSDFEKYFWFTPNQRRDSLIEYYCALGSGTTEVISKIKNLGNAEQQRRKLLPEQFVECPYCKGYHDQKNNTDCLCESCERTIHIIRFDKKYDDIRPS